MGSEAAQVEAAVEVDDVAGGERELPGEHGAGLTNAEYAPLAEIDVTKMILKPPGRAGA